MNQAQTTVSKSSPVIDFANAKACEARRRRPANASELTVLRDALPFFRKGRGKVETSWWDVIPTGNYVADLDTGKKYAREFLPLMMFNAGAASLGSIISDMARAGRDPVKNAKPYRAVDAVALGFILEIGGMLQSGLCSVAIAATAIKDPSSDLGPKFLELVESGEVFRGTRPSTLAYDPNASIFSAPER